MQSVSREDQSWLIDDALKVAMRLPLDNNKVFQAKPGPFKEVKKKLFLTGVDEDVVESISKLKLYKPGNLWKVKPGQKPSFWDRFKVKTPQYFIVRDGKEDYLVNTEGYDYGRYVVKLIQG